MNRTSITLVLAIALTACASRDKANNESTEQLLAASGFRLYLPKHPDEEANLKAMPQRRIIYMDKAVKPTYLYADHDECDCIYVGGQAEADRFQQLYAQQQAAEAQMRQSQMNQMMYGMGGMGGFYPMGMYGMGGMGVMGGYW